MLLERKPCIITLLTTGVKCSGYEARCKLDGVQFRAAELFSGRKPRMSWTPELKADHHKWRIIRIHVQINRESLDDVEINIL